MVINSSYKNIVKVRDLANNITTIDYNISKLTIDANGGIVSELEEIVIYWLEDSEEITILSPIKAGYAFTGWSLVGSESSISGTIFTMGNDNSILTANCSVNSYTLTVNANSGTWSGTTPQSRPYNLTTTIANPNVRDGYVFNGWSVSGTFMPKVNMSIDVFLVGGGGVGGSGIIVIRNHR